MVTSVGNGHGGLSSNSRRVISFTFRLITLENLTLSISPRYWLNTATTYFLH